MSQDNDVITVYSDHVCPFCYLGRRSLEEYEETRDNELEIEWEPFDLRSHKRNPDGSIDFSIEDGKDDQYFERVRQNIDRLKDEYDADEMLDFDDLPENLDSLNAQAASLYVQSEHPERWREYDDAIFEALWVEGEDIGQIDVLARLAETISLAGEEIRSAVEDEALRTRLRERFNEAHRRGVTGVPTFVYNEYAARGAVPPEHLERLVEGS